MIHSFRCQETLRVHLGQQSRAFPAEIQRAARRKLAQIDDQWRICFEWDDGAHNVEIVDYH